VHAQAQAQAQHGWGMQYHVAPPHGAPYANAQLAHAQQPWLYAQPQHAQLGWSPSPAAPIAWAPMHYPQTLQVAPTPWQPQDYAVMQTALTSTDAATAAVVLDMVNRGGRMPPPPPPPPPPPFFSYMPPPPSYSAMPPQ
jgi:hypothetical protein